MSILRFSSFVAISLLLMALPVSSSHAAVKCATANAEPALNGPCGQLGETRMLGDYSAIVACVVKDKTQTKDERDCTWKSMAGDADVPSGVICGLSQVITTATSGVKGDDSRSYSSSSCTTSNILPCQGVDLLDVIQTAYRVTSVPSYTPCGIGGLNQWRYFFKLNTCPSGYTNKFIKTYSDNKYGPGDTTNVITYKEYGCVKD